MQPVLPKMEGFVIYNPATGLFSKGGTNGTWAKRPKIYTSLGHLKSHLTQFVNTQYRWGEQGRLSARIVVSGHYKGCQVLNVTDGSDALDIHTYMMDFAKRERNRHHNPSVYQIVDEWDEQESVL